jgi:hypothetical protein
VENKKDKIIRMIKEAHEMPNGSRIINGGTIEDFGLCIFHDCGDVAYIMKIANKMGYKCNVIRALYLYQKSD